MQNVSYEQQKHPVVPYLKPIFKKALSALKKKKMYWQTTLITKISILSKQTKQFTR